MTHPDRVLIRAKDIGLILSILVMAGYAWKIYAKPAAWDQAAEKLAQIEPVVWQNKNKTDVLEAHFDDIIRRLDRIERKIEKG